LSLKYIDIDPQYNTFIFELDDVLLPAKDYDLQVYYLFANFIEYLNPKFCATELVDFIKFRYASYGNVEMFENLKNKFKIEDSYHQNLNLLFLNAKLPLKLLLYKNVLSLLQDIIINRKQIFILTPGNAEMQLNKLKQTEWNGVESCLKVYFEEEYETPKLKTALNNLIIEHKLSAEKTIMIGSSNDRQIIAQSVGINYLIIQH